MWNKCRSSMGSQVRNQKEIRKESKTCVQMLEDVVANVEEWKRSTATKQDIAILSLKIDELKAAQEIREANLTGAQSMSTKF